MSLQASLSPPYLQSFIPRLFQGGFAGFPKWFRRHARHFARALRITPVRRKPPPGAINASEAWASEAAQAIGAQSSGRLNVTVFSNSQLGGVGGAQARLEQHTGRLT
jgi:hypothetical protein